jgi:hypothetical protein
MSFNPLPTSTLNHFSLNATVRKTYNQKMIKDAQLMRSWLDVFQDEALRNKQISGAFCKKIHQR